MPTASYVTQPIATSGAALADLQAGGLAGLLTLLVAANPALANPTVQATVNVTAGAATSLPAGAYYLSYGFVGRGGRTLAGGRSAVFTIGVSPNNAPQVTLPALPTGAASISLYLTAAGGAAGSETLYATGVTATTANLVSATWADPLRTVPAANTTGLANLTPWLEAQLVFPAVTDPAAGLARLISNYFEGDPIAVSAAVDLVTSYAALYAALAQAAVDVAGLVYGNPGTLATGTAPTGLLPPARSFP